MRRKADGAAESGTCNVCSAPCSSCMHLKSGYLPKTSEVSDETFHLTAMSHNSINDNQQCAASENSNHVSVNSNHDSLSENAESKLEVKSADIPGASIETKSCFNLEIDGTVGIDQPEKRSLSNNNGGSKIEGIDDNTSCVSKVHDDRTVVSYSRKNAERKSSFNKSNTANVDQKVCDESLLEQVSAPTDNSDTPFNKRVSSDAKNLDIAENALPKFEILSENVQSEELLKELENENGEGQELHNLVTLKSLLVDESGDSDVVEHDVKVCDICGDAGREDLLAICSRCSDGAEHTYCMREMLQKVPEGDWLCEECKVSEETEKQRQEQVRKASQDSLPKYGTRSSDPVVIVSESKQQDAETTSDSPVLSGPDKKAIISKENSFISIEKEKTKLSELPLSGLDVLETANTIVERLQAQRGLLGKSSSFSTLSSKPRETVADDNIKSGGSSSTDMKNVPPNKVLSKAMSFKSVNSARVVGSEAKVKMISGNFSLGEVKRMKPTSEKITFERKNSLKVDQIQKPHSNFESKGELAPRGDTSLKPNISNIKDTNACRLKGKQTRLSKSSSFSTRKFSEGRTSLSTDINPSDDSRACPKDEPSTSSAHDSENLSRQKDSLLSEKIKGSLNSRSTCNEALNKGKEVDHSLGSSRKGSDCNLKAAIEAAMLKKPGIYKRKRENYQSDGVVTNINDASNTVNQNVSKDMYNDEDTLEEKLEIPSELLNDNIDMGLQKNPSSIMNLIGNDEAETSSSIKVEEPDPVAHTLGNFLVGFVPPSLAVPKSDYLWQGAFEVCRTGGYAEWFGGMQAHLSSFASPKVLEVVKQFPRKLSLDEVPRTCAWPSQFLVNGVKEDNIALYFFAKDVQSFERHYKGLLANTIKNDLALKGSIDGLELLIYPSLQLPEKSQRWNMLFFLWGVFRGRKPDNSDSLKKSVVANTDAISTESIKEATSDHLRLDEAHDNKTQIVVAFSAKNDAQNEDERMTPSDNRDSSTKSESLPKDCSFESSMIKEDIGKKCSTSAGIKPEPSDYASGEEYCELETVNLEACHKDSSNSDPVIEEHSPSEKQDSNKDSWKHHTQSIKVETNLNEVPEEEVDTWQASPQKRTFIDLSEYPPDDREFKMQKVDLGASSSASSEPMAFFPMETQLWREHQARDAINLNDRVPNLELALGADAKPFSVAKKEEGAVPASLSLSLSFPFDDTEAEEKSNVSTSLFLFRRFNDK